MTKCSFKNCKNHTSRTLKTDGVSYFRFPRDPIRREAWTSIVARQKCDEYFIPNERSVICSDHFLESDKYVTAKDLKRLHKTAVPRLFDTKTPQTSTDLQHNAESSNNSEFENCICVECYEPVHGEQFMCVQCADHKLCVRCAIERGAHREHFLLRVPLGQPLEKVEMILQKLRLMLENDSDESEHEDEVKMEVKDEVETYDEDPLTFYVKPEQDELEQEQLELEKLEREVLADKYNNMLKESKDISDVNNAPHGSELQPILVGGTTASNTVFNQHIVVKQEDEVSLHTSTIIPSISPSFSPIIPKVPTGTNTSKQVQTPILVARPAYLMELNKLMATIPGAATERPVDRELQTVPVSVVGRASARKHNLVTENLQIRVAKDHYDESEDIQ